MSDEEAQTIDLVERRMLPVGQVHPNTWNPNQQDEEIYRVLAESLNEEGFGEPALVRPCPHHPGVDYEVVNGEHRYRLMKESGAPEIPVVIADLDDVTAKLATLRRNRTRGGFDTMKVAALMGEMRKRLSDDEIQQRLGYTPIELDEFETILEKPFGPYGGGGGQQATEEYEISVPGELAKWFDETLIALAGKRESRFEGRTSRKARGMKRLIELGEEE